MTGDKIVKVTVQTSDPKLVGTKTKTTSSGEVIVDKKTSGSREFINSAWEQTVLVKPEEQKQDLTEKQIENLMKLGKAEDFMKDTEGAKLAENIAKQGGEISSGQKKWLKKQGIDSDAFMQNWRQKYNGGIVDDAKAQYAKDEMAALSETYLDGEANKSNKPSGQEKKSFIKKLFNPDHKEKVKQNGRGVKVKIHSSADERDKDFRTDVSDDVARQGNDYLDAYNSSGNKKRAKIKEYDEDGNVVKTKIKYDEDGNAVKVSKKTVEAGKLFGSKEKLTVKEHKDGDITVKGDLEADYIYGQSDAREIITNNTEITKKETINTVTDNDWLRERTINREEQTVPTPDTSGELHGNQIIDTPNRTQGGYGFKNVTIDGGKQIRDTAEEKGVQYLLDGYCGNKAAAKDKISTEAFRGNLNQQNAKHMTGCFIHSDTENGWAPDYGKLNELINLAQKRDAQIVDMAGPNAGNQILPFIKLEIDRHNAHYNKGSGGSKAPNSYNGAIDMSQFPEWFQKMPNAEKLAVK